VTLTSEIHTEENKRLVKPYVMQFSLIQSFHQTYACKTPVKTLIGQTHQDLPVFQAAEVLKMYFFNFMPFEITIFLSYSFC